MPKLRCAVIGVGYLGKFHAEKYAALENAELVAVCDIDSQRCQEVAQSVGAEAVSDYHELASKVDAVSIVVPTSLHHEVAATFLKHGVHVLLEKPITRTLEEAEDLINIAKEKKCVLQIGHLERFNPALKALDKILDGPRFIESHRLSPFKPRNNDVNVVLDLMIHDIDIIQTIVNSPITSISANGIPVLSKFTDIANARIEFENNCVANVTASRVSAKVERKLRMFQHDAYIVVDMHNKQLSVHRKGTKEMFPGIPEIIREEQAFESGDALRDEIVAFIDSIQNNKPPVVSGEDGKLALKTATEITRIVREKFTDQEKELCLDAS